MIYTKHNLTDTIVALATPPGVGAIGVIRLSGKHAIAIADSIFLVKTSKIKPRIRHILGRFGKLTTNTASIT